MDADWERLCANMANLKWRMFNLGLIRELQVGDEYFPDPEDIVWNEAIEAAAAVAGEHAEAILALKLPPSIYQGPVVVAATKHEGGA